MPVSTLLAELHVGDGYSVLVAEGGQPGVMLNAQFIESLAPLLHAAHARALALGPARGVETTRNLCERLRPVLRDYERAVREWIASRPLPNGATGALAELDVIRKMLDDLR